MDAKDNAYLDWLEETCFSDATEAIGKPAVDNDVDASTAPMPVPWMGFAWAVGAIDLKSYYRGYMWATIGIGLTIVGVYGLYLIWGALCWFVNGGIRGVW